MVPQKSQASDIQGPKISRKEIIASALKITKNLHMVSGDKAGHLTTSFFRKTQSLIMNATCYEDFVLKYSYMVARNVDAVLSKQKKKQSSTREPLPIEEFTKRFFNAINHFKEQYQLHEDEILNEVLKPLIGYLIMIHAQQTKMPSNLQNIL